MHEFTFNGEKSSKYGLIVNSLPPIVKAPIRTERIEIDGINGDIISPLGYMAYDKEITVTRIDSNININDIIKWLNCSEISALILSNEPSLYYKAQIIEQIDFTRLENFEPVKIKFHVQPFKYQYNEANVIYKASEEIVAKNNINLENTSDTTVDIVELCGASVQNGTPSPDSLIEIESASGRNLFDKSDVTGGWIGVNNNQIYDTYTDFFSYTNYIKVNPSTTYTLNFHNVSSLSGAGIMEYDNDKAWLNIGLSETQQTITFTTSENTYYIRFTVRNDSLNYVQLERGSIATGYVPYKSIAIRSTNKNLLNAPNNFELTGSKVLIPLYLKAGTYILSVENIESVGTTASLISFNTAAGTTDYYYLSNSSKSKTVTFKSDVMYYNIYSQNSYNASIGVTAVFTNLMIRHENSSAEYEPHISNQANITLLHPFRSLPNGVCDRIYKQNGKWYDEKKIDSFILDGSADEKIGYDTKNTAFYYYGHENLAKKTVNNSIVCAMSNYFKGETANNCVKNSYNHCLGFNTNSSLWIRYNELTTVADFKTWLSTHNTEVLYELATPITTEITDANTITALESIKTYNEVTNIITDVSFKAVYYKICSLMVNNNGTQQSKPLFKLTGKGTISFDNFIYTFPDNENEVEVDSDKEDAYFGKTLKNRNMRGEFPTLKPGKNTITWTGKLNQIEIVPRSRWL